jgi:hypothetical protein
MHDMIDYPGHITQPVLDSFITDSSTQRTSSYGACDMFLWIDDSIVEIAREDDYKAIFRSVIDN